MFIASLRVARKGRQFGNVVKYECVLENKGFVACDRRLNGKVSVDLE